jgi:hypothetical protein
MSTSDTNNQNLLRPTEGHIIAGVMIDDHRFLGRLPAAQLFQIAPDPRDTEDAGKLAASRELQELRLVRQEVQRLFAGAKEANVGSYAKYIVDLHNGENGLTPPITLYVAEKLNVQQQDDGTAFIQVKWDQRLAAIDGETQLAARHEAASMDPDTKRDFVAVYICHGRDEGWARQSFHDLNTLAIRPNAALTLSMDARDHITRVTRTVGEQIPLFKGRVNNVRRQLRSSDAEIVTITTLRGACVTVAEGISGVQHGAKPVTIADDRVPAIEMAAIDWFRELTNAIGPSLENRQYLASSPTAMSALGAMGHQLVDIADATDRIAKARAIIADFELKQVDWSRGKHWQGIAGKFTPKGTFSVGGSKETAYAVFAALTDRASEGYGQIRRSSASKTA